MNLCLLESFAGRVPRKALALPEEHTLLRYKAARFSLAQRSGAVNAALLWLCRSANATISEG